MGIDLGTTNTCISALEGGRPVIIPNSDGSRTTPSVVAFTDSGDVLVGASAKRQAVTNPTRTIHSVKRLIGQPFSHVEALAKTLAYPVVAGERGAAEIQGKVRNTSPIEISAHVLRAAKSYAAEYFGEEVNSAIITVPAYFDDAQRAATQDAARVAGLDVLRIINEPTAAALAYGWEKSREGVVVVYDWGGGTFDCSVLDISDGVVNVRSTRGDSALGGTDIDNQLMRLMTDNYYRIHGIELGDDPVALQRLREAAENAKIELSSASETDVILPFLGADDTGPKHLQMSVSRHRFEGLIGELVEQTISCCRQALDDAGVTPAEIGEVLLVGGSTKIPIVQQRLEEFFGQPPRKGVNADEVVAIGAAIQGGIIEGEIDDVLLLDVLPLSLGIGEGTRFASILRRNTTIPTYRTETFSTVRDFQSSVLLRVYQGDHPDVNDNRLIGTFRLENLPPARAGQVKIEVKFEVDENGLLQVTAQDSLTQKTTSLVIRDTQRLSDSQIEKLGIQLDEDF